MDAHLPKALHGWRGFTREVAIIVLGILIALALQQAVEQGHDRASAAQARGNIRAEIRENMGTILLRHQSEACVSNRLREIAAYLQADAAGQRPKALTWIGAPYAPLVYHARYQAAQSAGKYFLLPEDEQQGYSGFYLDFDDFNEADTREWYDWAQLRTLAGQSTPLSPADRARLQSALQDARAADAFIRIDSAHLLDRARTDKLKPTSPRDDPYQIASVCLSANTPYGEALAKASTQGRPFPQ